MEVYPLGLWILVFWGLSRLIDGLGVIVGFMVSYGLFSMGKALLVGDPTLRNRRQAWKETEN